ncbi:MAG: sulfotransferase [Thermoleophilaceae bacterium]|nr:sulfotransferase [Thermoleophilaceae bacterium]
MAMGRRRAVHLSRRSHKLARRADQAMAGVRPRRRGTEPAPKTRLQKQRRAKAKASGPFASWQYVLAQAGSQEGLRLLLDGGLFGRSLPRVLGLPTGDRILVLVPHQDDEGIGAAGTLLLAARAGKRVHIVYFTDGATSLGDLAPEEVSRVREAEARRAWQRVPGVTLEFLRYPTGVPDVSADAVQRLGGILDDFAPSEVFVPTFLEEPYEHRLLNRWLALAHRARPLDAGVDVWGYQITTRMPGTAVVDITSVWRRKRRLNRAWRSQNAFLDYAHLAMGQDIANSAYLKGGAVIKPTRAHAEVFLRFSAPEYLTLCDRYLSLAEAYEASLAEHATPNPDFFVVGMQKAGTYWLTAMLDAHPQIRCFPSRPAGGDGSGEAHLFDVLARLDGGDYGRFRKSMSTKLGGYFADLVPADQPAGEEERAALRERLGKRFARYCDEQRRLHGKPLVGEKTTETVHHLDLVEQLFGGVRKVCVLRDPRDRAVSFHFHQIRKGRRDEGPIARHHVEEYIERVRADYAGLLEIQQPFHVMTYEGLSADPVRVLRPLLDFLGAYSSEAHPAALVEAGRFKRLAQRSPGEELAGNHYRKGVVGDWREKLDLALARKMVAELEPLTVRVEERLGLDLSAYRSP